MKSELGNIAMLCDEHSPKPNSELAEKGHEFFIGKFVKLAFKAWAPSGEETLEHMWVKVGKYNEESKELEGVLDNDPILDTKYKFGDEIAFRLDEIEDVAG